MAAGAEVIAWRGTRCPRGHQLRPGRVTISWLPCDCAIALETNRGHYTLRCQDCHAEQWEAVRYQPPHVTGHHMATAPPPPL